MYRLNPLWVLRVIFCLVDGHREEKIGGGNNTVYVCGRCRKTLSSHGVYEKSRPKFGG